MPQLPWPAGRSRCGRPARLNLTALEDRITPVAGAPDLTFARADTSAGLVGLQRISFSQPDLSLDYANAVATDNLGRIVVAGSTSRDFINFDFAVVRLLRDGSIDRSFGPASSNGQVIIPFDLGGTHRNLDEATSIAIDPATQAIYVAGYARRAEDGNDDFAIVKLTPNGMLDTTFAPDSPAGTGRGIIAFDLGGVGRREDHANGIAIDPVNGDVVLAGYATRADDNDTDFAVARLTAAGKLVQTFGNGGKQTIAFNFQNQLGRRDDRASAVAIDPIDRAIVLAGTAPGMLPDDSDFAIARLNSVGVPVESFNPYGLGVGRSAVAFDRGGSYADSARALVIDPATRDLIVVGSATIANNNTDFAIARLVGTTGLPADFGTRGKTTVAFDRLPNDTGFDDASAVTVDGGQIVVVGTANILAGSNANFSITSTIAVARLNGDGTPDPTFDPSQGTANAVGAGKALYEPSDLSSLSNVRLTGSAIVPTANGIVIAGTLSMIGAATDFAVLRLLATPGKLLAVGGTPGQVRVFDPEGNLQASFTPFADYTNGVNVATGDVNGDGIDDIVAAAAAGNPHVKIFDGKAALDGTLAANPDGHLIAQFFSYGQGFNVGAFVAIADLDRDGMGEVITGASPGNPHVKVIRGSALATRLVNGLVSEAGNNTLDRVLMGQFFAYGQGFNVGATVAAGDFDGDGTPDLVTGASRGNPHVKIIRGADVVAGRVNNLVSEAINNTLEPFVIGQVFPFRLNFNVGSNVAAGDTNGDGFVDLVVGATTGNPNVSIYHGGAIRGGVYRSGGDGNQNLLANFMAETEGQNLGVSVAMAGDLNSDGAMDILTGGTARLRAFTGKAIGLGRSAFRDTPLSGITGSITVG